MVYRSNGFGNAWDRTSPGTIRSRYDRKGREYFERAVQMRSHTPAKSGAPAYGISWERYSFPTQQAAPAPAAPAPAPAPKKSSNAPKAPEPIKADPPPARVTPVPAPAPPKKSMTISNTPTNITNGTLQIKSAESNAQKNKNTSKGVGQFKRQLKILNVKA